MHILDRTHTYTPHTPHTHTHTPHTPHTHTHTHHTHHTHTHTHTQDGERGKRGKGGNRGEGGIGGEISKYRIFKLLVAMSLDGRVTKIHDHWRHTIILNKF